MRIISKFHDYYDTAMGYGHDDSVLFKRETPDLDEAEAGRLLNLYSPFTRSYYERVVTKAGHSYELCSLNIFFCGKAYYGVSFEPVDFGPVLQAVYDLEHLQALSERLQFKLREERKWYRYQTPWQLGARAYFNSTVYNKDALAKVMLAERHSIVSVGLVNRVYKAITVNPRLKQHHFAKVLPPYQAFQELDMWHSGVMAEDPAMRMVQIEDKYRIPQHGFDKWSFRKQGEKSK